jgi:type I restriction enzyme M protein
MPSDYPQLSNSETNTPLAVWYEQNQGDVSEFEKQMRRKVHYVIKPEYLWRSVAELARMQSDKLLRDNPHLIPF